MGADDWVAGGDVGGAPDADEDRVASIELVRRAQGGNREALDRLVERYRPILRRWAAGRLPGWARSLVDSDDLVQDTMMRTLHNMDGFVPRHDGALAAYLRQALNNRIRDEVRNARRRPGTVELADDQIDSAASPLDLAIGSEASERYEHALVRLSDADRELILLRIEMGQNYEDVARATNKPSADAARMGVSRALVRLASEMDRG